MATSVNCVTGDLMKSKVGNQSAYSDNWDRIFGSKKKGQDVQSNESAGTADQPVASNSDLPANSTEAKE